MGSNQFLTFLLQSRLYGVSTVAVREINQASAITPIPQAPHYVAGVMNLRGKIIPIVDLRARFGFASVSRTRETCIIVTETPSGDVGLLVDKVEDVVTLSTDQLAPTPSVGAESRMPYVTGIGKLDDQIIVLIDPLQVVSGDLVHAEAEKIGA